jgi:hypothetical protein
MCLFRHYSVFSHTPKFPGSYPWEYAYTSLGIIATEEQRLPDVSPKVAVSVFSVNEFNGYRESPADG